MSGGQTARWWFVVVPALAVGMGWGVRGQLGHSTGAMIPGALLGLALSILLNGRQFSPGLAVGLTAVGFGFGAAETTRQTAGLLTGANPGHVTNLGLAYPGLALKGALWAMFAGAGLGLALAAYVYRKRDAVIGALLLVATFYPGWWAINKPKLIYFSVDRPEIWGGLLVGGITLLVWVTIRGQTRIPLQLAGWAALSGGVGYPVAVALAAAGMHSAYANYPWMKLAEITFGAFMGAGIGFGTYLIKDRLPQAAEIREAEAAPHSHRWEAIMGAVLAVAATTALYQDALPWIILGSLLWCGAFYSQKVAWHTGVTVTFFGTAANAVLLGHSKPVQEVVLLWALAGLATLMVAWKIAGWCAESDGAVARKPFLLLLWAFLVLSYCQMYWFTLYSPAAVSRRAHVLAAGGRWPDMASVWVRGLPVELGFTVAALALTWMIRPGRIASAVARVYPQRAET